MEQVKSTPASIANTNDNRKWEENVELSKTQLEKHQKLRRKANVAIAHVDIIKDEFWEQRPWLLSNIPGRLPSNN